MSSNTTNEQSSCDSLGKITWVRQEFLCQAKISDILKRHARNILSILMDSNFFHSDRCSKVWIVHSLNSKGSQVGTCMDLIISYFS